MAEVVNSSDPVRIKKNTEAFASASEVICNPEAASNASAHRCDDYCMAVREMAKGQAERPADGSAK
jgi:hypothetical protein